MVSTADQLAIAAADLMVTRLGETTVASPMTRLLRDRASSVHYVHESDLVLLDDTVQMAVARGLPAAQLPAFEPGGPRERLYFDPGTTRAAIVTCGGLCPGLNNVIRGLVLELSQNYGVIDVVGFRNGYRGLVSADPPMMLTPAVVHDIHNRGGTILGTSRGDQDAHAMVATLNAARHLGALRGRRRRHVARRAEDRRSSRRAWLRTVGDRSTEDHRQRHPVSRSQFRVPDRLREGRRVDSRCPHRGELHDPRCRPGEADGPAFGLYRVLRRASQPRRRFRARA